MIRFSLTLPLLVASATLCAAQDSSTTALEQTLASEQLEIIHAKARPDGSVEIVFGDVTETERERLLSKLRNHPDVKGIEAHLSPRTFCNIP
ncbi:MAG: hypothetical protein ACFCUJ_14740 [Thiotrichales bacterium]